MAYFPFFADIGGKKWLIARGGRVSLHRVRSLLPYDAIMWVVSIDLSADLLELGTDPVYRGRLALSRWASEDGDLLNADFVIAATSDQTLNSHISTVCHKQGTPVDVVNVEEECSFIFLSIVRDGPVAVGISTGGANPVIARYLEVRISRILPNNLGGLAQQLSGYRGRIKVLFPHSPEVRSGLFYELAEKDLGNGCGLASEQTKIITNKKLEQKHE